MEMICQNPGASGETKRKRKRKRDRSGDKKKTNLVSQIASAMDEMEMISQTAGASCGNKGKMKRCTKLNHGRSGDKKKSSPKPNLVDMVSESGAGASGEKNNSSPKPKLKYKRSDMAPRKEDIESDASLMAFYERWCCYHKVDRSPDEMKERFKYFKKDAISAYKANKDRTSASYVLWYFSDWTPEESWLPGYCLPAPPVSDEEMRRLRMHSRRRRMRRIQMGPPKKKLG